LLLELSTFDLSTAPVHLSQIIAATMLSQLQTSYSRLEQSLQRLTDSIAAYNPSTSAADELVSADDALNEDLNTCM
jgi:hypothetical protein